MKQYLFFILLLLLYSCNVNSKSRTENTISSNEKLVVKTTIDYDTSIKVIHTFVALCDNKFQGIVPVPAKIGNGQDAQNNLYWGCAYGIKTFFKNSKLWTLIETRKGKEDLILERAIFKHKTQNVYMIADAYNGKEIKQCTIDFLQSSTGIQKDTLVINEKVIGIAGNAQLINYIGHNGLMDFTIENEYKNVDNRQRKLIILACYSKPYFSNLLTQANVDPILWSTHLMAPEAYILHDAINEYLLGNNNTIIKTQAAKAYAQYQKCTFKAANALLVNGW